MYDYFRTAGSYDEIQGLSGLFNIRLENDDIQDFDLRWEQALLSASDLPSNKIVESLYISKLQNSSQIQSIMALYNQEIIRGGRQRVHWASSKKQEFQDSKRNYRARSSDYRKGTKFFHKAEDRRRFSVENKWVLFKGRVCVVFYMRLPRVTASQHKKKK